MSRDFSRACLWIGIAMMAAFGAPLLADRWPEYTGFLRWTAGYVMGLAIVNLIPNTFGLRRTNDPR